MPLKDMRVVQAVVRREWSLKVFILTAALVVSFVSFSFAYFITSTIYQGIIVKRSHVVAGAVSRQVFSSMLQLMEKGWTRQELNKFLGSVSDKDGSLPYRVDIYRSKGVEALYGSAGTEKGDAEVAEVFRSGGDIITDSGYVLRNIYPVKAGASCTVCHSNAVVGEVLGVLSIRQDIGTELYEIRNRLFALFFLLSPVPFLMAVLIARFVNRKIGVSSNLLHEKIEAVNSVKDMTTLTVDHIDLGFTELNSILSEIERFAAKVKNIAVDREVLEFEMRVLQKFIITSEVVQDWKRHVSNLLLEINTIIQAYALFSIFRVDEEVYDLEIFWKNTPSDETRERFEHTVLGKLKESPRLRHSADLKVVHNVADPSACLPLLKEEDIDLQTKSLILESPQIGGVVGIGVQSVMNRDSIRTLVIEGILATLLNVVGSMKAIYKYTKELEHYATRDPLTNLYNQRIFWELLAYEVGRAERYGYKFSLLVIDVDNFKDVNDTYGHIFGDKFLMELASRIHGALRLGDILGRYGGDEFVVVLPESDEEQAFAVAERIKNDIGAMSLLSLDGTRVKATVSIGFAVYPVHAGNDRDLFLFADNMMYRAKVEGKNTVIIPTEDDVVEVFRKTGEKTLVVMNAIETKTVIPYYQPIINMKTGKIEYHEVLSRIMTDKGLLTAGEFIEVAERLGVIGKLDHVVIERVLERMKLEAYSGCMFLNLSPKSLIQKEFIPSILKLTEKYGLERGRIIFEITERDTVKNMTLLEKFVHSLKAEGFKFAIDDFGSGFSSFHYIKRFPIDFVKIEGEFIRNMAVNSKDMSFVKTMVLLAKEFNIKTVAEYVEDERTLQAVRDVGIDYGQGYHIGRPLPDPV